MGMKPICHNGTFRCYNCGTLIDDGFIPPARCDLCSVSFDWNNDSNTNDSQTINARLGMLEVRIASIIDALKLKGII